MWGDDEGCPGRGSPHERGRRSLLAYWVGGRGSLGGERSSRVKLTDLKFVYITTDIIQLGMDKLRKKRVDLQLDGVGPIINRPSTDWFMYF